MPIQLLSQAARAGVRGLVFVSLKAFGLEMQKERAVLRKWRTALRGLVRGSLLDGGAVRLNETFPPLAPAKAPATDGESGGGSLCIPLSVLRNNLRLGKKEDRTGISLQQPNPASFSSPRLLSFSGIRDGEGAGAPRSGAHGKPGRCGEAFIREATVRWCRQRIVWNRWKRQQQRPRRRLSSALQPAQVGSGKGKETG